MNERRVTDGGGKMPKTRPLEPIPLPREEWIETENRACCVIKYKRTDSKYVLEILQRFSKKNPDRAISFWSVTRSTEEGKPVTEIWIEHKAKAKKVEGRG